MNRTLKFVCLLMCIALFAGCAPAVATPEPAAETPEAPTVAPVEAAPLTGSFTDPNSGMEAGMPDQWTGVANTGSIGLTELSADWLNIVSFTLLYEDITTAEDALAAAKTAITDGTAGFSSGVISGDKKVTVFDQEFNGFTWTGHNAIAKMDYAGFDTVAPYGKNFVHISAYAPADQIAQIEPTLLAIINSLVQPADDYGYVPPLTTSDWTSFTSDKYALSVSYPPDWQTPIDPWIGEGLWLNSADWMTSVAIWVVEGTDADQALANWETTQTIFPTLTVTDGEPVTILGAQYATKMGVGKNGMGSDIDCGMTYVPYNGKLLEIVWYAGSGDYWTNGQDVFPGILASIQGVTTYNSDTYKLAVTFPSTWNAPLDPWVGKGIWLNSADWMTSVAIWVVDGTDAVKALTDWESTQEIFPTVTVTDGTPITILDAEYQTKQCEGSNAMGTAIKCGVTYVPYNGQLLEIVWYASTDGGFWDNAQSVFPAILTSIKGL